MDGASTDRCERSSHTLILSLSLSLSHTHTHTHTHTHVYTQSLSHPLKTINRFSHRFGSFPFVYRYLDSLSSFIDIYYVSMNNLQHLNFRIKLYLYLSSVRTTQIQKMSFTTKALQNCSKKISFPLHKFQIFVSIESF